MHVLDQRVRGDHEVEVSPRPNDRGIVARPDQDSGSRPGKARQDARQQGMLAQIRYGHERSGPALPCGEDC